MKRVFWYLLVCSLLLNVFFIVRKVVKLKRVSEVRKLEYFKDISHKEGFNFFLKEIQDKYPQTTLSNKYYIVYLWDSISYDFMYKKQMFVLDSMAKDFGKYKFEYVFATEMKESPSKYFLKRNNYEFKNAKFLYDMDDFISGLYGIKGIKIVQPTNVGATPEKTKEYCNIDVLKTKQKPFYLVLDASGRVLYTNENKFMILKDTLFLNTLNALAPTDNLKTLN